jgi:hypothetical protein
VALRNSFSSTQCWRTRRETDAGTWTLCILQFYARDAERARAEIAKVKSAKRSGGIQETARVDFVRHDPGAEILAVNWFAVNKPGDMRSAVAQEVVEAAG